MQEANKQSATYLHRKFHFYFLPVFPVELQFTELFPPYVDDHVLIT